MSSNGLRRERSDSNVATGAELGPCLHLAAKKIVTTDATAVGRRWPDHLAATGQANVGDPVVTLLSFLSSALARPHKKKHAAESSASKGLLAVN